MLTEEISLLRSTLNYIDVARHLQLEELAMKTRDLAYEISYVINSVTPVWYLTLRLSQLLEKIHLVKKAIQEKKSRCEQVQPQAKELTIWKTILWVSRMRKPKLLIKSPVDH
ncbi:Hypothetical predicted protein [Olea europaea subsp. europaea]|uniref:Uncharacterized protein n=1 Tax=Olea europaea subsp. europaea TaxID=158383 RepID=A0A8S0R8R1_OLEEU|nr:Hypothetical predicted protein [Olea europaea subsp. europaea]